MSFSRFPRGFTFLVLICPVFVAETAGTKSAWAETLYSQDFEDIEEGETPLDFLVLEGEFAVKKIESDKVLELPGAPLGTFACLMGPGKTENVCIEVRIWSERRKRRFPVFGVGLSGVSGFRFQVNPVRRQVELLREEVVEATAPYRWESGTWVRFQLGVKKEQDAKWRVEGKIWPADEEEPETPSCFIEVTEKPLSGRPSLWGIPYAGKPIRYDDLVIREIEAP